MGALHEGHRSLIKLAKTLGDVVVVSIFVNPLQFGPGEDYARYPRPSRTISRSARPTGSTSRLRAERQRPVPGGAAVTVDAGTLGSVLEGHSRPGHFNGVLTVVLKLFNIIRPQVAIFGERTRSNSPASSEW